VVGEDGDERRGLRRETEDHVRGGFSANQERRLQHA
jgi:hypothetical protein